MDGSKFAQLLNEYMELTQISDHKLARAIGINKTTIARWRIDGIARPNCNKLKECAEFLERTAKEITLTADKLAKSLNLTQCELTTTVAASKLKSEIAWLRTEVARSNYKKLPKQLDNLGSVIHSLPVDLKDPETRAKIWRLTATILHLKAKLLHCRQLDDQALYFQAKALALTPINPNLLLAVAGCSQSYQFPVIPVPPTEVHPETEFDSHKLPELKRLNEQPRPVTTRPITHPSEFFGRSALLRKIFTAWNRSSLEHVAIIGAKQSGKTSLLNYLRYIQQVDKNTLRPSQSPACLPVKMNWVLIDFEEARTHNPDRLMRFILHQLNLPTPDSCKLDDFNEILDDNLQQPTLILMDNVDKSLHWPNLTEEFWGNLRYLGNQGAGGRLGFGITSRQSLVQLENLATELGKPSPFINIFGGNEFHLNNFTEEEMRELISYIVPTCEPDEIEWIVQHSEGRPWWIQIFCKLRLELGTKGPDCWKVQGLDRLRKNDRVILTGE